MSRPVVKINFVDFGSFQPAIDVFIKSFTSAIETFADIEISDNPDFLICGCYGGDHWDYDCVKIYYSTEEHEPDFNVYDYAIGQSVVQMYDRYLYEPQYLSYRFYENTKKALEKHKHPDEYFLGKKKFCNFIYSNGHADKFRENTFHALNAYKHVDSAGKFLNNMGSDQIAGERFKGDWEKSKIEFMKDYRFTIAFGNAQRYDYADEKIFDAWNAGTIPVFWGDPKLKEKFNTEAYIDCCDCKTAEEVVERVKEIEEDPEKYLAMQKAPILKEGSEWYDYIVNNKFRQDFIDFLHHIMTQSPEDARRTSNGIAMKMYRRDQKALSRMKNKCIYRVYRKYILSKFYRR